MFRSGKMAAAAFLPAVVCAVLAAVFVIAGFWWYGAEVIRALFGIILSLVELNQEHPRVARIGDWIVCIVVTIFALFLLGKLLSRVEAMWLARKSKKQSGDAEADEKRRREKGGYLTERLLGVLFWLLIFGYLIGVVYYFFNAEPRWHCVLYPFKHFALLLLYVDLVIEGLHFAVYPILLWPVEFVHSLELSIGASPLELVSDTYSRAAIGVVLFMTAWILVGKCFELGRGEWGSPMQWLAMALLIVAPFAIMISARFLPFSTRDAFNWGVLGSIEFYFYWVIEHFALVSLGFVIICVAIGMLAGFKQLGLIASAGVVGLTSVILAVVYWEHLNLAFFKAQWNWLLANYPPIAAGALICLASIGLLAGLKLLTPGAKRLIRNGILKPVVIGLVVLVVILTCALPYQQMIVFTCLMLGVMGRKWLDGVVGRFMLWGLVPIFLFMVLSKPEFWDAITSSIHMLRDLGAQYSSELGWLGVTVAGCAWVVVGSIIFVRYIRLYPLTVPAMLFWLVVFVVEPWLKGMLVV